MRFAAKLGTCDGDKTDKRWFNVLHWIWASREKICLQGLTRSDTSRAVQQQKMARGLKVCILEVEELYYLCYLYVGKQRCWSSEQLPRSRSVPLFLDIQRASFLMTLLICFFICLGWGFTSQSTIFQSSGDGATAFWVLPVLFGNLKIVEEWLMNLFMLIMIGRVK